jgi:hypothetical protein
VHVNVFSQDVCAVLLSIPSIRSLVFTHDCVRARHFTDDRRLPFDIPALEEYISRASLTKVELDTLSEGQEIRLVSPTLVELELAGKGLVARSLACPALEVLKITGFWDSLLALDEAAVRAGCPLLRDLTHKSGWWGVGNGDPGEAAGALGD